MFINLVEIIAIITTIQLLLLSLFIILHKKGKRLNNKILSMFILLQSLPIIEFLLFRFKEFLYYDYPHFFYIGSMFIFLWGPSVYFYTKSMTYQNFSLKKSDIIHVIPFFVFFIYMIIDFHIENIDVKRYLLATEKVIVVWEKMIIFCSFHIQILVYLIASLIILRVYRQKVKNYFSSISSIKLSWLKFILAGFTLVWMVDLIYFILWRSKFAYLANILDLISLIITFTFVNIIVFRGLNYPEILCGIEDESLKEKYQKYPISETGKKKLLKTLAKYMEEKKPYFIPSLTIDELSRKISIPPRYLSQIINESLNQNFYDFINGYRINEVKKVLSNPDAIKKSILEILFDAGFNSKASFNRIFKRYTGLSPTEFRKINSHNNQ